MSTHPDRLVYAWDSHTDTKTSPDDAYTQCLTALDDTFTGFPLGRTVHCYRDTDPAPFLFFNAADDAADEVLPAGDYRTLRVVHHHPGDPADGAHRHVDVVEVATDSGRVRCYVLDPARNQVALNWAINRSQGNMRFLDFDAVRASDLPSSLVRLLVALTSARTPAAEDGTLVRHLEADPMLAALDAVGLLDAVPQVHAAAAHAATAAGRDLTLAQVAAVAHTSHQ